MTFSVSAALAFACKNYLGTVPVEEDGSVYFEVPSGKAIYLQALDAEGRCVRSMRSFIQAAPGTTRSCVGCHEDKKASFAVDHANLAQRQHRSERRREMADLGGYDGGEQHRPGLRQDDDQ